MVPSGTCTVYYTADDPPRCDAMRCDDDDDTSMLMTMVHLHTCKCTTRKYERFEDAMAMGSMVF